MMRGMERKKSKRRPRRAAQKAQPAPAVDAVVVETAPAPATAGPFVAVATPEPLFAARSEERRVGKGWRGRGGLCRVTQSSQRHSHIGRELLELVRVTA